MNVLEGARRIKRIGRIILSVATAVFVLGLLAFIVSHVTNVALSTKFQPTHLLILLIFFCVYPAIIGAFLLALGWIVEGFALPRNSMSGD